jgi:hypothetical protein
MISFFCGLTVGVLLGFFGVLVLCGFILDREEKKLSPTEHERIDAALERLK